jgi:hypothetical protein
MNMNLRNDFDAEVSPTDQDVDMILTDLENELSRLKSERLREKKVREICARHKIMDESVIFEAIDLFV